MRFLSLLTAVFFILLSGVNVFGQVVVNETTLTSGSYTVPSDGQVTITIKGGDGGNGINTIGGEGATAVATFAVNAGDVIRYVVGEAGVTHA
ncbi:MAG TPA: hypothetical protein DCX27_04685, partial [Balneola sp.]|nr:hypothetical protein [Balneola sp.]